MRDRNATVLFLACLLLAGTAWAQAAEGGANMREITPAVSDDILFNPGMGLYLQYPSLDSKPDEWFMKVCDIAYYRLDWNDVNPEEGKYTFDVYFGPIFDFWVKQQHKRVAFRVMCESMHSRGEYVTPRWVFDKGVPGVQHTAINGKIQTDPVFWDDRYLDVQCEFIRKFGEYLADKPGVEFVDIGSIGEWGEMHLMRWTPQQLEETGFSEYKYARAYRRVIDAHVAAFPHTRIFLNVGGQNHLSINDYAAIHGVNFRQDGLMPSGASYDCGEWLYKPYSRRGILCNFEFHSSYDDMVRKHWDVKTTIEKGLSAPISYMNTNLFGGSGYRKATPEVQALLADAARRLGYRFVLAKVELPAQMRVSPARGSRLPLMTTWRNDGIAPCYDSLAVRWSLVDGQGTVAATLDAFPVKPTTQWWPGEEQTESFLLRAPAGLAPGEYALRVQLRQAETDRPIMLGIAGRQDDGSYALGTVTAVAAPDTEAQVVYSQDFEGAEPPGWGVSEQIAASLGDEGHDSAHCLLVSGSAQQSWNYVQRRAGNVLPYARYRLSCWVCVDEISRQDKAPYLKVGINEAGGKWITNFSTNPYDLKRVGTWQKLEGNADLPANAATADLALEKGDNSTPVTLKLRLDDVKLELIEAP